ncbi:5,6-dimethylbenzimidazole synthase [Nevskia sp.]|uniref:5,6-dimethylbenzimidazole synthase n=1 Tax=Nevskia sp. TaxID=1929292 RepID=UPI0025CD46C3|nr:5,6-dimethylbenzimidazole synthase [Nevskia sp.]
MTFTPDFSAIERAAVHRAIHARRDMRHFAGGEVAPETLQRLLEAAHAAPSVGLSQPWRFLRITDQGLRAAIHARVQDEVQRTAVALDTRQDAFLKLKVEGVLDCAELLIACVHDAGPGTEIFGRRTMPAAMSIASVACAVQNLWLAARAEGLGLGWVSMFEPAALAALLRLPADTSPIAVLCLGPVTAFYPLPMLQQERWREPRPLSELLHENLWQA